MYILHQIKNLFFLLLILLLIFVLKKTFLLKMTEEKATTWTVKIFIIFSLVGQKGIKKVIILISRFGRSNYICD